MKADGAQGDFVESGHKQMMGIDLGKGAFRMVQVALEGVKISDGKTAVAIPMDELLKLAATHEPGLAMPQ